MNRTRIPLVLEELEGRDLLSAGILPPQPLFPPKTDASLTADKEVMPPGKMSDAVAGIQLAAMKGGPATTFSPLNPTWFTPAQIQQAYGFNQLSLTGAGQTIAIIDVYDDPNILSDANFFSSKFSLPSFTTTTQDTPGLPTFTKLNEYGQDITSSTSTNPRPQTNSAWTTEISLDVEWAHAIAPQANIVLIEANSSSTSDVFKAMSVAQNYGPVTDSSGHSDPVSVVSMSWGYNESNSAMQKNMLGASGYDSTYLTTPTGHPPITFVAATLDNGSRYGVYWPAISPNVVGVGGTVLTLDASGNYGGETGWRYSTGGISKYEAKPSYQSMYGVVPSTYTMRTNPDVAYGATNFATYDTAGGYNGWYAASGTSAGTPQWAGLIALADQERAVSGLPSLKSTDTLDALYALAGQQFTPGSSYSYFHDITTGSNGAYHAGTGYDLVTGIGTPVANQLIPALASYGTSAWPVTK